MYRAVYARNKRLPRKQLLLSFFLLPQKLSTELIAGEGVIINVLILCLLLVAVNQMIFPKGA